MKKGLCKRADGIKGHTRSSESSIELHLIPNFYPPSRPVRAMNIVNIVNIYLMPLVHGTIGII